MKTAHRNDCKRVFARYDAECPRCNELSQGAAPRKGWGDRQREADAAFTRRLKAHDCKAHRCGPVCVAFDW